MLSVRPKVLKCLHLTFFLFFKRISPKIVNFVSVKFVWLYNSQEMYILIHKAFS